MELSSILGAVVLLYFIGMMYLMGALDKNKEEEKVRHRTRGSGQL